MLIHLRGPGPHGQMKGRPVVLAAPSQDLVGDLLPPVQSLVKSWLPERPKKPGPPGDRAATGLGAFHRAPQSCDLNREARWARPGGTDGACGCAAFGSRPARNPAMAATRCSARPRPSSKTLVWTRGELFPPDQLEGRRKCPRRGSRRVTVVLEIPAQPTQSGRQARLTLSRSAGPWAPRSVTAIIRAIEPNPDPATPNQVALMQGLPRNRADRGAIRPGHRIGTR